MIGNELRPMEFIHDHERSLIFLMISELSKLISLPELLLID